MATPDEPIPIAFCITELDRGGAEKVFCELVTGLDRQQWNPQVFCLGPRSYFVDVLESRGITVTCFGGKGFLTVLFVLWRLTRALKRFRPALLQTFLFHGNVIGRVAGRLAWVPIIVSGVRVAERQARWHVWLDRWTNQLVNHNVCVSQGVADFSILETRLPANKVSVIPNGVDFDTYAKATPADLTEFGFDPERPVVISVGRLEEQKGIRDLLQAAAIVLQNRSDCQFLIVGNGYDRAALEALAANMGLGRAVCFAGHRSDVPELLRASSLFVLASLWEGMPNALLEAMAAGLPVVATNVEGSREVIVSERSGLLVAPANSEELAKAMLRVLNDSVLARELVRNSQSDVINRFTNYAMVGAYERLYHELISRD